MFCEKCGNAIREGAKFCTKCGAKVEAIPTGGNPGFSAQGFAPVQPPVIGLNKTEYPPKPQQPVKPIPTYQQYGNTGGELMKVKDITYYNGDSKKWAYHSVGTLTVKSDALEYKMDYSNAAVSGFGLIGMAVSKASNKDKPPIVFRFSDIQSVSEQKKMGMAAIMEVRMKDGSAASFMSGAIHNEKIRNMIALVQQQLQQYR